MPEVTGIALAMNQDGRLELVATSSDGGSPGAVWHAWQTTPGGRWTGWQSLGEPGGGALAAAVAPNADGRLEVAVMDQDGVVWHRWQTKPNNGWWQWYALGEPGGDGFLMSALVPAQNSDGRLETFLMRRDGTVRHHWQTSPNNGWSQWQSLDKPDDDAFGPLAVGANADGRLEVVVPGVSTAGEVAMWHRWQLTGGGRWSDWASLGRPGGQLGPGGVPVLAQNQDGRLELFTVGDDRAVWRRRQQPLGGGWSAWESLGSKAGGFAEVGVGANADGRLELFATLHDGTDLWHRRQTAPNNGWAPWASLGSVATGTIQAPALVANADGRLELFLRTPDTGGLYQLSQKTPNGGWTPGRGWPPP
jgi:hypothetical protein